MAYIRKMPNGNFQATVYLGRDADGKPVREYITDPSKRVVERKAKELEINTKAKALTDVGNMRVVDWFEMHVELNEHDFSPSTIDLYLGYLKNHYKPFFKLMRVKQINHLHLKQFQSRLLRTLAPSTVSRIMSALRGAFTEGMGRDSPFEEVTIVKPNDPDVRAPSSEEFLEILEAVRGSRYEIPVLLAAWVGLRRAEVLALRVNDLNFEKNTIRIDEAWSKTKDGTYVLKDPKSKRGKREERIPDELMTMIREHIMGNGKVVNLKPNAEEFLFSSRPDTFSTSYRNYLRRRNAPAYTFHELRHYHATWLFENNIPDKYAAKRMGQTVEVLKETYQHLGLKKQEEVDEKIMEIANTALLK